MVKSSAECSVSTLRTVPAGQCKVYHVLWKLGRKRLAKFAANPRTVPTGRTKTDDQTRSWEKLHAILPAKMKMKTGDKGDQTTLINS